MLSNTVLYTLQDISLAVCSCLCLTSILMMIFVRRAFGGILAMLGGLAGIVDFDRDGKNELWEMLLGGGGIVGLLNSDLLGGLVESLFGKGNIAIPDEEERRRGGRY